MACVDICIMGSKSIEHWATNITVVAQLRPLSKEGLSARTAIPKEELLSSLRTPLNPGFSANENNYFLGDIIVTSMPHRDSKLLNITFNRECTAWHYGWKASKWVQDFTHVFDVVILEDVGNSNLDVIGSFISTDFTITSTKKKRNDLKLRELKEAGAPRSSKSIDDIIMICIVRNQTLMSLLHFRKKEGYWTQSTS